MQALFKTLVAILFIGWAKIGEGYLFCNKKLKNGWEGTQKGLEI
jgi:hypothetical protein